MESNYKQIAYRHIRSKLLDPSTSSGRGLSDRNIARELGISRTPVRQAIHQLEIDGLIEHKPRSGTFPRKIDRDELEQLYDLRDLIEPYAAARAATRIAPRQLQRLQAICDELLPMAQQLRQGTPEAPELLIHALVQNDLRFHVAVMQASGNEWAQRIIENFRILISIFRQYRYIWPPTIALRDVTDVYRDHSRIVRALRNRDADSAHHLMALHVHRASRRNLAWLDQQAANHTDASPVPEPEISDDRS